MKYLILLILISWALNAKLVTSQKFHNRYVIKDKLLKIFSEDAEKVINTNFFHTGSSVAGPCDYYEQVYNKEDQPLDVNSKCVGGKMASKVPLYAIDSALRSAALIKTCTLLTQNKKLLAASFLNKKILVQTAYENFYPFNNGENILGAYKNKINNSNSVISSSEYRKAMLVFCISPGWQKL